MIVTVTPNPSLDRTVAVAGLARGGVHRGLRAALDPGGKGVNVARVLASAGLATTTLLPCGGPEGARLGSLLRGERVPVAEVPVHGATRSNITVVEADGTTTKFNESGSALTAGEARELVDRAARLAAGAEWLVTCGSLPADGSEHLHADLVRAGRRAGARTAVDTSGPALTHAAAARPDLVKPNHDELAELAGRPLPTLGAVLDVAHDLRAHGVGAVLVSLGADGALLAEASGAWHARGPAPAVVSTVGAGDALLAGFLGAGGAGPEALRAAVAHGAAAVELPGSRMPGPRDPRSDNVRVTAVDTTLTLTGAAP
ncbi:1-phosphofructokinase [Streptomonospora wellingtoniae]|uniref:1-phosphofructokinase n=1 Tax=Streptomonospora wellingtoniae TaxID=3075544 RepID=A0ABU2L063_9ACTN|nr:1-phosphofructokinase [Streptomonospora sp. DSM 45055]MDT0304952.1 1-phosphofructokinase [Streptomonospora sp. DSM 45055]